MTSITIPDNVTEIGTRAFSRCSLLKNIKVSPEQPAFAVIDDVLFNKADKALICYPAGKQAEYYEIPQGIRKIEDYAFWKCKYLTNITIPDSVTSIGDSAFYDCEALTSITIPDSVTSIGFDAFWGCKALTNIVIPDSVTSIEGGAFAICLALTNIIIPDSVISIEFYTFYHCDALKNVTIPESVTYIDSGAFEGCDNLTLTVPRDSYAAQYAKDNGLNYTYPDANDWLNN